MRQDRFWIVQNRMTGAVMPAQSEGKFQGAITNRGLSTTLPPRLYRTELGARKSLKAWLKGRYTIVRVDEAPMVGTSSRAPQSVYDALQFDSMVDGRRRIVVEPDPHREAIRDQMEVIPVTLSPG